MGNRIGTHFQQQWIKEMLEHLKVQNDNESKETALWAWGQVQQACMAGQAPQMHNAM